MKSDKMDPKTLEWSFLARSKENGGFVQPCLSLYIVHLILNNFPLHYPKRFRNGNSLFYGKIKVKPKDWFNAKVYQIFYDPLVSRLSLWFAQETCETIDSKLSSNKMAPTPNEVGATSVSGTTNGCPYPPVAPIPNVSRKKSSKSRHPSGQTWARICLILKVTGVCDWESSRPRLCTKFALFNMSWQMLKVVISCILR